MEILVLGAGISGLTSAWQLAKRGHLVRIWTRDEPLATTSGVAAAIWYPFEAQPLDQVTAWSLRSLRTFTELARDPRTGIRFQRCDDLADEDRPLPEWTRHVEGFATRTNTEDGFAHAWSMHIPVIETPKYLPWLVGEIERMGGVIDVREVTSLEETEAHRIVVQCTGLGARELSNDAELYPIRGQVVRTARADVGRSCVFERSDGSFGYVVVRSDDLILGGTKDHGEWSLEPDPDEVPRIVERCTSVEPTLMDVEVLETRVGLRPGRSTVRLEAERLGERLVIHNYGHGGCGITLSHACAEDVADLAESLLRKP